MPWSFRLSSWVVTLFGRRAPGGGQPGREGWSRCPLVGSAAKGGSAPGRSRSACSLALSARSTVIGARPTGGTRRFSQDDLRRFRRISELVGDGVNLTGIC